MIDYIIEKMKTIILKCFKKNIIHTEDSNEKISTKEIRMKKIKCINLYLKNKQIARNRETWEIFVFQAQKVYS